MNTGRYVLLTFLSATLLWACQKEKQPITKLPDSKVVAVGDSVQPMHLTMADSVCGKYLVYVTYNSVADYTSFGVHNDTLVISKFEDTAIIYTVNTHAWPYQLSGCGSVNTKNLSQHCSFASISDHEQTRIYFPYSRPDSIYITDDYENCSGGKQTTISGIKIH